MNILLLLVAVILTPDRVAPWPGNAGIPGGIPDYPVFTNMVGLTTDGSGDNRAKIQNAISICPKKHAVMLPNGLIAMASTLFMYDEVVLRGSGMTNTQLLLTGSGVSSHVTFVFVDDFSATATITAGFGKGSTDLTLNNAGSFAVGDVIRIDQLNDTSIVNVNGIEGPGPGPPSRPFDHNYDRAAGQRSIISGKAGNVITISPPLVWNLNSTLLPQVLAKKTSGGRNSIKGAGVENLTLTNNTAGFGGKNTIEMKQATRCWVRNVEIRRPYYQAIAIQEGFQLQIEGCTFKNTQNPASAGSGVGYCVTHGIKSSWNLVQNNISDNMLNMVIYEYGGAGNVCADNFSTNTAYFDHSWLVADYSQHAIHCGYNLIEGNIGQLFQADMFHGSSSDYTLLRNYYRGHQTSLFTPNTHLRAIELNSWQRRYNLIGNVLGDSFWNSGHRNIANTPEFITSETPVLQAFGYFNGTADGPNKFDSGVFNTLISHGNFSRVTGTVTWQPGITDQTIPNSLFRSGRPEFWGTNQVWPSIGSDKTPRDGMNPAYRRYAGIPEGGGSPSIDTRTVTVVASAGSPAITMSPSDINGASSGSTTFTRTYPVNTVITLTAPATSIGQIFKHWIRDDVVHTTNLTASVTLDFNFPMVAIYTNPPPPVGGFATLVNVKAIP